MNLGTLDWMHYAMATSTANYEWTISKILSERRDEGKRISLNCRRAVSRRNPTENHQYNITETQGRGQNYFAELQKSGQSERSD